MNNNRDLPFRERGELKRVTADRLRIRPASENEDFQLNSR